MATNQQLSAVLKLVDEFSPGLQAIQRHLAEVDRHQQAVSRSSGGLGGAISNVATGLATAGLAFQAVSGAVNTVAGAVKGLASDFIQAEQVTAQLQATLASTGGVSGQTQASIEALSTSLSRVTRFEDEAITSAQSLLLTFTNISGDTFPGATKAVLDMAQAMGTDLKQASIQVGKALNDPIGGVGALRRVGVQLSESQEEAIKSMVALGDTAGAQAVILGELQTQFGGSAEAAGKTFAGQLAILEHALGDVREIIGEAFIPALTEIVTRVTPVIHALADELPEALETLTAALEPLATFITDEIGPRLTTLGEVARNVFKGDFEAAGNGLVDFITADLVPSVVDGLQQMGASILSFAQNQLPLIATQLVAWAEAFREWIGPASEQMLRELGNMAVGIMGWLEQQAPGFYRQLYSTWIPQFVMWAVEITPQLIAKLIEVNAAIGRWIVTEGAPAFGRMALAIGTAMIEGIAQGLQNAGSQLGPTLSRVVTQAVDDAKRVLGIQSPSRVTYTEVGLPMMEGMIQAIVDGSPSLNAAMQMVVEEAVKTGQMTLGAATASAGPLGALNALLGNQPPPSAGAGADPEEEKKFRQLLGQLTGTYPYGPDWNLPAPPTDPVLPPWIDPTSAGRPVDPAQWRAAQAQARERERQAMAAAQARDRAAAMAITAPTYRPPTARGQEEGEVPTTQMGPGLGQRGRPAQSTPGRAGTVINQHSYFYGHVYPGGSDEVAGALMDAAMERDLETLAVNGVG